MITELDRLYSQLSEEDKIRYQGFLQLYGTAMIWDIKGSRPVVVDPHRAIPHPANEKYPNGYYMIKGTCEDAHGNKGNVIVPANDIVRETKAINRE